MSKLGFSNDNEANSADELSSLPIELNTVEVQQLLAILKFAVNAAESLGSHETLINTPTSERMMEYAKVANQLKNKIDMLIIMANKPDKDSLH